MSLTQWVIKNRKELDKFIRRINPNQSLFNDSERRLWVENDEGLYNWARSEGVNI